MREYPISAVEFLKLQQQTKLVNGAPIIVKCSPTEPRGGYMDHYELKAMNCHWITSGKQVEEKKTKTPVEALQTMRDGMGYPNRNLCTVEIHTKYETLMVKNREVGLWRYYPRRTQYNTDRPCFIFIHGGGWVGGTPYTVENPCRLIAQLADAVVFNVDYSLAPEIKYPGGFDDCFAVVKHIYGHAKEYGIDKTKIGIGGDSAGGNLAAACAIKDRDMGSHMIALQVLMYACLTLRGKGTPDYKFDISQFEISTEQFEFIDKRISIGRSENEENDTILMGDMYFTDPENQWKEPYASPLMTESFAGLPQCLSIACEYDGLRIQDELYAQKLGEAGVPVKSIRYRGIAHAFIDRLGFVPQAEDLCIEIAEALKEL